MQEIHPDKDNMRLKIKGMKMAIKRPHKKYGSSIFVRDNLKILSKSRTETNDIEILTVELTNCAVPSIYKLPNIPFKFTKPIHFENQKTKIVISDFNSHNNIWGYNETNEEVEKWAKANNLTLVHDTKLPSSFNSGRWRRGYNPDIIFVSGNIKQQCKKKVETPIVNFQYRP